MSWAIIPEFRLPDEPEALSYIAAVEAADGQELEPAVKLAYNTFIKGCKADGIWPALKASCVLAGARTLDGALVPLVGTAPTNYNFVSGDYNRETGLIGDGSTKYVNSNRNNNADPQNSKHLCFYAAELNSGTVNQGYIGAGTSDSGASNLSTFAGASPVFAARINSSAAINIGSNSGIGFTGASRNSSSSILIRTSGATTSYSSSSQLPLDQSIIVFGRNLIAQSDARLSFYSIGESLDLALLDARVTTLMSDLAAAIV